MDERLREFIDGIPSAKIDQLENMANALMSLPDIAVLLELDEDMLNLAIRDGENILAKVYRRGKASRVLSMHMKDIEQAEHGESSETLNMYLQQMNAAET